MPVERRVFPLGEEDMIKKGTFMPTPGFPVKHEGQIWILDSYAVRGENDLKAILVVPSTKEGDAYIEVELTAIGSIFDD